LPSFSATASPPAPASLRLPRGGPAERGGPGQQPRGGAVGRVRPQPGSHGPQRGGGATRPQERVIVKEGMPGRGGFFEVAVGELEFREAGRGDGTGPAFSRRAGADGGGQGGDGAGPVTKHRPDRRLLMRQR